MQQIIQDPISTTYRHARQYKTIYLSLLLWIIVGSILRFSNLDGKTVWSDEWSTIVFSLGHSFRDIPLDKAIDLATMLELVQIDSSRNIGDTIAHLLAESTHPPLYFVLSHGWLELFASDGDLISIWQARSLSAVFGAIAIPAMFGLGWLVFESLFVAQIAAALMAVSPYGIYLAQEARHYTLAILWVTASLACWVAVVRCLSRQQTPKRSLIFIWILVNSLGMATHYFFGLNLLAQALILLVLWWQAFKAYGDRSRLLLLPSPWRRIGLAVVGTIAGCSFWVYRWQQFPHERLTDWIQQDFDRPWELLFPLGRLLGWLLTMFVLPPVEGVASWIIWVSVLILLPILGWFIGASWRYLKTVSHPVEQAVKSFVGISLALNLIFAYILGRDLTLAARFQYFYFPLILILGAGILNRQWRLTPKLWRAKIPIAAILLFGCLGGVVIVNNYGFQKSDRPDLVVPAIAEVNQNLPIVIATVYRTHGQAVETIGLAWEWQHQSDLKNSSTSSDTPQFLLLSIEDDERTTTANLYRFLEQMSRLDLWLVNFSASTTLEDRTLNDLGCVANLEVRSRESGYRADYYRCQLESVNAKDNY